MTQCPECLKVTSGQCAEHSKRFTVTRLLPAATHGTPLRCPVCEGRGLVPAGFYSFLQIGGNNVSMEPEQCRSCRGSGVIWDRYEGAVMDKAAQS